MFEVGSDNGHTIPHSGELIKDPAVADNLDERRGDTPDTVNNIPLTEYGGLATEILTVESIESGKVSSADQSFDVSNRTDDRVEITERQSPAKSDRSLIENSPTLTGECDTDSLQIVNPDQTQESDSSAANTEVTKQQPKETTAKQETEPAKEAGKSSKRNTGENIDENKVTDVEEGKVKDSKGILNSLSENGDPNPTKTEGDQDDFEEEDREGDIQRVSGESSSVQSDGSDTEQPESLPLKPDDTKEEEERVVNKPGKGFEIPAENVNVQKEGTDPKSCDSGKRESSATGDQNRGKETKVASETEDKYSNKEKKQNGLDEKERSPKKRKEDKSKAKMDEMDRRTEDIHGNRTPTAEESEEEEEETATEDEEKTPKEATDEDFFDQDTGEDDQKHRGKTRGDEQEHLMKADPVKPKETDQKDNDDQQGAVEQSDDEVRRESVQRDEEEGKLDEKGKREQKETERQEEETRRKEKLKEIEEKVPQFVKESPLDQLLKNNVKIDGTVESISELETAALATLQSMENVMKDYLERLKLQALKDFTADLGKFRGDFSSIKEAYQRCGILALRMYQKLKELRHTTEDVTSTISRKFQNEDLSTWIDITEEEEADKRRLNEETIAAEKIAMAKAAEARAALATAASGVAEAQRLAAETEIQAAEAEAASKKASAQACSALIAAEEARIAAQERKRAEDAAKKRSEERAKQKAEEERKKQEEEEKRAQEEAARKGTSVEDEKKLIENERERKERERRSPKNWPRYTYSMDGGDFDPGLGCIVRAIEGSLRRDDIVCERVDQSAGDFKLEGNEELISNILHIHRVDPEKTFTFEEPMSIAIPYCVNRISSGREAVIKFLSPSGKWVEQTTTDCQFEDIREMRFVETRTRRFGVYVVVLRLKKDTLLFTRKANKASSTADSRITFMSKAGTFKQNTNLILEVQPLEINTISDLRQRSPGECSNLLSASPIVKLSTANRKLSKTLTVTVPLPPNAFRQKRPMTAIRREPTEHDLRPQTARPSASAKKEIDEADEEMHFIQKDSKVGWGKVASINLHQPKNKDIVTLELMEIYEKFVILRTKLGARDHDVEKMAAILERTLLQRTVQVFLRQKNDDASDVVLTCTNSHRAEKVLKALESDGYEEGPPASKDLILQEGQPLTIKFRGNVKCKPQNMSEVMVFNSHIQCKRFFRAEELDRFAQKGLHCYRGFAQVYTTTMVPKPVQPGSQPPKPGTPLEMIEAEVLLSELLISLPKPEAEPPKPLNIAPIPINEGPLTDSVFRYIASELGDEWKKVAQQLNLKPMRIQAILRQNVNKDTPKTRYDMLVTWAKRIPKAVDKVGILCHALVACGRGDLAEDIKDRGEEYRRQRFMSARTSYLRQAFVKVAKTREVFQKWQKFAKRLGVPDEEIKKIEESGGSGQEKCYTSLETWKNIAGESATVPELATHLRTVKQERLSREVESIMVT